MTNLPLILFIHPQEDRFDDFGLGGDFGHNFDAPKNNFPKGLVVGGGVGVGAGGSGGFGGGGGFADYGSGGNKYPSSGYKSNLGPRVRLVGKLKDYCFENQRFFVCFSKRLLL
jgi:hypothetical protein